MEAAFYLPICLNCTQNISQKTGLDSEKGEVKIYARKINNLNMQMTPLYW